jgi:hypothetical protein
MYVCMYIYVSIWRERETGERFIKYYSVTKILSYKVNRLYNYIIISMKFILLETQSLLRIYFLHNDVTFILKIWLKIYFEHLATEHIVSIWPLGLSCGVVKAPAYRCTWVLKDRCLCLMAWVPGPQGWEGQELTHVSFRQTAEDHTAQV